MSSSLVHTDIDKIDNVWILSRSLSEGVILRMWCTTSLRGRFRWEVVGDGPVRAFMPDDDYDEAMQEQYDSARLPKPLRECEYRETFEQLTQLWNELTRLVNFG